MTITWRACAGGSFPACGERAGARHGLPFALGAKLGLVGASNPVLILVVRILRNAF